MSSPKLVIHQTLHGYQGGHRLLGGSIAIAPEDRRRMLTMSDSPDAGSLDYERSLLLGYPLPSGDFYVLSKTWLAPEVDRPGCVWTHSLLLDDRCLRVPDPTCYLALFHRPRATSDAAHYEKPVPAPAAAKSAKPELPDVIETVLWTLYQPPLQPVDLRIDALRGLDSQVILLTLWAQQWPQLRRAFSFGQAPRVGRRLNGALLDLQVTERPQKGSWDPEARSAPPRTVVKPIPEGVPLWCRALAQDLRKPGALRDFIWDTGEILDASRANVWALASLWTLQDTSSDGQDSAATAIYILDRAFPEPEQAIELKSALLAHRRDTSMPGSISDRDLLRALAKSGLPESLAGLDLALFQRSRHLLKADAPAALELVEAIPARPDEAQKQIAEGIADGLTKTQIVTWAQDDVDTLAKLVNRSAALAGHSAVWDTVDCVDFWPLVRNPRAARERRRAMLRGMLAAHSRQFVDNAFTDWADISSIYLELLAEGEGTWRSTHYLGKIDRKAILSWLNANGPAPKIISLLLDTWKHKHLAQLPPQEWVALWDLGAELDDRSLALYYVAACDPATELGPQRAIVAFEALLGRRALKKKALTVLYKAAEGSQALGTRQAAALLLSRGFRAEGWKPIALLDLEDLKALESVLLADGSGEIVSKLVGELGDTELPEAMSSLIFKAAMQTEDHNALHKIIEAGRRFIPWL